MHRACRCVRTTARELSLAASTLLLFTPNQERSMDREDFRRQRDDTGGFVQSQEDGTRGWVASQVSHAGRGPKGWMRPDERIYEDVSDQLSRHREIDASDIEVMVANGEITLTGTVDERRTKRLVEDLAENVAGVKDVHNHIRLKREPEFTSTIFHGELADVSAKTNAERREVE